MKRWNFFADENQLGALRLIQKQTGISVSEQIRRAVGDYLKHAKPIHEALEKSQAMAPEPRQMTLPFTDH